MLGLAISGRHDFSRTWSRISPTSSIPTVMRRTARAPTISRGRNRPSFLPWSVSTLGGPARSLRPLSGAIDDRICVLDGGCEWTAAGHRASSGRRADDGSILNRYWDDSDTPRDESYREDVALAEAAQQAARLLPGHSRRGRERLGLWIALVCGWTHDGNHRYHRNRAGGPQQFAVRIGKCHPRRLRTARRCRLRARVRTIVPARAEIHRPLSLGRLFGRVPRLSLDEAACGAATLRGDAVPSVRGSALAVASGGGGADHRARIAWIRRHRHQHHRRHRPTMGLSEWLGAAAMDSSLWSARLRAHHARRGHCLSMDRQRQRRLCAERKIGGEIRRGHHRPPAAAANIRCRTDSAGPTASCASFSSSIRPTPMLRPWINVRLTAAAELAGPLPAGRPSCVRGRERFPCYSLRTGKSA